MPRFCREMVWAPRPEKHHTKTPRRKQLRALSICAIHLCGPSMPPGQAAPTSCHIGNKAEGRFITHAMYAAGHPPLPPFELVTYCRDMPRHYHAFRDLPATSESPAIASEELIELAKTDPDKAWEKFHFRLPAEKDRPEAECPNARELVMGTVAAFEATMKLLADDAKDTPADQLLDFAHFDCYACHHDLKVPSWRQKRGYRGVPGRPTMRPWATETLMAVLDHAQAANGKFDTEKAAKIANEIRTSLKLLNAEYDARPFGDPAKIAATAEGFARECRQLRSILAINKVVYDPAETESLYRVSGGASQRLAGGKPQQKRTLLGPRQHQQAIWSLHALQQELRAAGRPGFSSPMTNPLMNGELELERWTAFDLRGAKRERVAGARLDARMKQIAAFDLDAFLPAADKWLKAFGTK